MQLRETFHSFPVAKRGNTVNSELPYKARNDEYAFATIALTNTSKLGVECATTEFYSYRIYRQCLLFEVDVSNGEALVNQLEAPVAVLSGLAFLWLRHCLLLCYEIMRTSQKSGELAGIPKTRCFSTL